MEYVGFWMRAIAYLIDSVIVQVVLVGVALAMGAGSLEGVLEAMASGLLAVVSIVISLGYWAGMESSSLQATVGKLVIGVKVVDLEGNRLSFGRALGRTLAKILSGVLLLIGYLMVAFSARKQGLHDRIAGTLVVSR